MGIQNDPATNPYLLPEPKQILNTVFTLNHCLDNSNFFIVGVHCFAIYCLFSK